MTIAAWQSAHVYVAGDIVNPTVANGFSFISVVGGTSGMTEPSWSGRWPAVTDGTANTWAPYSIVTPATLRQQMNWTSNTGQYTDTILGNYILDAIASLEDATQRYLCNRPGWTVTMTSMLRAMLPIPGLRTATTVTYAGALQTANAGYWLLPDAQSSGVYTGIQFRPLRSSGMGPWWLVDPLWFDKALDSPFYPGNYGGGYVFTSMPNDTSIVGDWGYEPRFEPGNVTHAVEVLAGWYGMRPAAILADSVITPAGGIVSYAQMPPEVQQFVKSYSGGQQVVSVG